MSVQGGVARKRGKKNRKFGRNQVKCARYKAENRRAKNKTRKAAKRERRLAKAREKRESSPNIYMQYNGQYIRLRTEKCGFDSYHVYQI